MNIKEILVSSIKKGFLDLTGVDDYYIFWTVENGRLRLSSYVIAHKSSTLATIEVKDFYLPDSVSVIRDPGRLMKLINIRIVQKETISTRQSSVLMVQNKSD